jgi:hypothetical protein
VRELENGGSGEAFLLGDMTNGQGNAVAGLGLKRPETNDVVMPPDVIKKS